MSDKEKKPHPDDVRIDRGQLNESQLPSFKETPPPPPPPPSPPLSSNEQVTGG